ncbi:MAG: phospholipase D family protein [Shimia thalassica]|uniref:phospholipase D family protein n=1 Tax=Shimia thalassica TaxID=1715693 RepID=UPI003299F8E4
MKIELLDATSASHSLVTLMKEYDEFYWAVAWAGVTDEGIELQKYAHKIKSVTFGLSFCHTDPSFVDNLQGVEGAYVITKSTGGTFHPKVYCFKSGDRAAAIVGSSNFTFGGLRKNSEASVYVEGAASSEFFQDLFDYTINSAKMGEGITKELARMYREKAEREAKKPHRQHDPMNEWKNQTPLEVGSMNWAEYVSRINKSKHHNIKKSLKLLRISQKWFSSEASFSDFSGEKRRAVAGTLPESQKKGSDLNRDWGWFGSMIGAGTFKNRINKNNKHLAKALDGIPNKGEISPNHYKDFVISFRKAFVGASRSGGVATASRLLAMKRPDVFVCICGPNIDEASALLGFKKQNLDLDTYWDEVIEVVRETAWYNADKPAGSEGKLWESRVAMLDAILYKES